MTATSTYNISVTQDISIANNSSDCNFDGASDTSAGLAEAMGWVGHGGVDAAAQRGEKGCVTEVAPSVSGEDVDARWKTLCSQALAASEKALSDEDLLALLLTHGGSPATSRRMATQLISRFETFGSVISARTEQIRSAADIDPGTIDFLRLVRAAGTRLAREECSDRPVVESWDKLIAYLRTAMAHETVEQFRVLFLDRRNVLIADEVQHRGTIDHTPVYPREVVKRALDLDASAIIMVHNHPSNHPAPSKADVEMTRTVRVIVESLGIALHDHIVVSRRGHTSFRQMGLLDGAPSHRQANLADHQPTLMEAA